ncbi:MAG TPA: imidazole glycerol phosphate synthase subunit HisH [Acidimicrobiia bacterium]|jgi:imidazole glycerol phosphate synthase glutamine amidotransferase subunit|nr:imidazole glycerol phosphate synthase subunit HisH [Acidimicrobiia bacterium]
MSLVVVPTGTANTASVLAAFRRLGAEPAVAATPEEVEQAERVVLPGVGSFGAAAQEVDRAGMRQTLTDRISRGRPTLAICVGMQLLARRSKESDDAVGLRVIDQEVGIFPGSVRVPQLGWNQVSAGPGCRFVDDGWAYFANSYRLSEVPDGWNAAVTDHGGRFVSALERGGVLACQFHPELSGSWGSAVLARWLRA